MEKEEVFVIDGMTCAACALTVENAVNKIDHVDSAVVNLTTEKMTVRYNPDLVSEAEIEKAVVDAGYGACVFNPTKANQNARAKPLIICGISFCGLRLLRFPCFISRWAV